MDENRMVALIEQKLKDSTHDRVRYLNIRVLVCLNQNAMMCNAVLLDEHHMALGVWFINQCSKVLLVNCHECASSQRYVHYGLQSQLLECCKIPGVGKGRAIYPFHDLSKINW